jgi:hypothetical protein
LQKQRKENAHESESLLAVPAKVELLVQTALTLLGVGSAVSLRRAITTDRLVGTLGWLSKHAYHVPPTVPEVTELWSYVALQPVLYDYMTMHTVDVNLTNPRQHPAEEIMAAIDRTAHPELGDARLIREQHAFMLSRLQALLTPDEFARYQGLLPTDSAAIADLLNQAADRLSGADTTAAQLRRLLFANRWLVTGVAASLACATAGILYRRTSAFKTAREKIARWRREPDEAPPEFTAEETEALTAPPDPRVEAEVLAYAKWLQWPKNPPPPALTRGAKRLVPVLQP